MTVVIRFQLGNLAEWAVAIFTLLFFGATYLTIRRDHDEKRRQQDEQRLDDAQLVSVTVAPTAGPPNPSDGKPTSLVGINVFNGGRRQVDDMVIAIWNAKRAARGVTFMGSVPASYNKFEVLPWFDDLWDHTGFSGKVQTSFTDVTKTNWLRTWDGTLMKVDAQPDVPTLAE